MLHNQAWWFVLPWGCSIRYVAFFTHGVRGRFFHERVIIQQHGHDGGVEVRSDRCPGRAWRSGRRRWPSGPRHVGWRLPTWSGAAFFGPSRRFCRSDGVCVPSRRGVARLRRGVRPARAAVRSAVFTRGRLRAAAARCFQRWRGASGAGADSVMSVGFSSSAIFDQVGLIALGELEPSKCPRRGVELRAGSLGAGSVKSRQAACREARDR